MRYFPRGPWAAPGTLVGRHGPRPSISDTSNTSDSRPVPRSANPFSTAQLLTAQARGKRTRSDQQGDEENAAGFMDSVAQGKETKADGVSVDPPRIIIKKNRYQHKKALHVDEADLLFTFLKM